MKSHITFIVGHTYKEWVKCLLLQLYLRSYFLNVNVLYFTLCLTDSLTTTPVPPLLSSFFCLNIIVFMHEKLQSLCKSRRKFAGSIFAFCTLLKTKGKELRNKGDECVLVKYNFFLVFLSFYFNSVYYFYMRYRVYCTLLLS